MNWRETLGATASREGFYTHNSQKTQKPAARANSTSTAHSAYRYSEEDGASRHEALADVCQGVAIAPSEVEETLAAEDIEKGRRGTAFDKSQVQRRDIERGKRPARYTEPATCKHCGPVWLWFSGEVQGCPWCWNRAADRPIPRPQAVRCGNCIYFRRINHPHLGY